MAKKKLSPLIIYMLSHADNEISFTFNIWLSIFHKNGIKVVCFKFMTEGNKYKSSQNHKILDLDKFTLYQTTKFWT